MISSIKPNSDPLIANEGKSPRFRFAGNLRAASRVSSVSGAKNCARLREISAVKSVRSAPVKWRSRSVTTCSSGPSTIRSTTSARRSRAVVSSISLNCGLISASSGNRRRTPEQNEWIVCIFNPPGVSIARAKSCLAFRRRPASIAPDTPRSVRSTRSAASGIIAHLPKRSKRRFCISAAAALVYVRHRMFCGSTSSNNNRATRSVRTRVLPEPALADNQVDA